MQCVVFFVCAVVCVLMCVVSACRMKTGKLSMRNHAPLLTLFGWVYIPSFSVSWLTHPKVLYACSLLIRPAEFSLQLCSAALSRPPARARSLLTDPIYWMDQLPWPGQMDVWGGRGPERGPVTIQQLRPIAARWPTVWTDHHTVGGWGVENRGGGAAEAYGSHSEVAWIPQASLLCPAQASNTRRGGGGKRRCRKMCGLALTLERSTVGIHRGW